MTVHNKRYHAVASRLPRLPRELVHNVLDDLTVTKVLELISNHAIPYIDECVASHLQFKKLFTPAELLEIKEWFTLYLKICGARRSDPHPRLKALDIDAAKAVSLSKGGAEWIKMTIKAGVKAEMMRYKPFLPTLRTMLDPDVHIPDDQYWDLNSVISTAQIYEHIDASEVKLNTLKADQLRRMADLLEKYPTVLRTCCERTEDVRRNHTHRAEYLRSEASRMPVRQILDNQWVAKSIFAQRQFYILPYDRVLRVFLKVLQRYPPSNTIGVNMDQVVKDPDSDEEENNKAKRQVWRDRKAAKRPHQYPDSISFVLGSMPHCFTRGENRKEYLANPRVLNTKYSCHHYRKTGPEFQPTFYVADSYPAMKEMKKHERIEPMAEKEFEWLEAFLGLCEYMSKMSEPWSPVQTVSQYWHAHV